MEREGATKKSDVRIRSDDEGATCVATALKTS